MRLDVHVERLRLQLRVRRVVHARDGPRARQVMQVAGQLCELRACTLLLPLLFVAEALLVVRVEQSAYLLVLLLDVVQVLLPSVEIVLVLPAVVASVAAGC